MPAKKNKIKKESNKKNKESMQKTNNVFIEDISSLISFANSNVNYNPYYTMFYKTSEEQSLLYQIRTFKIKRQNKQDKIFEDLLKTFSLDSAIRTNNKLIEDDNELM